MAGEFRRRLVQMGLPEEAQHSVMALVQTGLADRAVVPDPLPAASPAGFDIRVARTFYKTAVRATEALGSPSLSMTVMLFDLFVAHEQGRLISVSSLCIASGAASTTALRQIGQLEDRGFVTRRGDEHDRRRCWVRPTARALQLVRGLVEEWQVLLRP